MIGSWRVVLTYTIAFYTYQSTFLSKKLNVEEKLTLRPSPTVHNQTVAIFTLGMPIFIPQGFGNLEAIPRVPQGISGNVMFSFILF